MNDKTVPFGVQPASRYSFPKRAFSVRTVMVLTLALGTLPVERIHAKDVAEVAPPAWQDPFLTRPPILDIGETLPGDHAPLACPSLALRSLRDRPLSLVDAVDIGLCANPQVQGAWAAIKVQAAALGEAKAADLPTLAASVSLLDDSTKYDGSDLPPTSIRGTSQNIALNWRVFDFGGRAAAKASASALLDAALASHSAALQKTLETLIGAYFDAQTALGTLQAKQKGEELARSTLETAQRLELRGVGTQSGTLQAMTALAKASLDRSRSQGDYQKALSMLLYALGVPPGIPVQLASDLDDEIQTLKQDLDAWLEQAQRAHPAILAAQAQLEAAGHKVKAAESEGLPSIDFSTNIYRNGRPNQLSSIKNTETVLALTLNIPLFNGFANHYKVRGAQAQAQQQQSSLDDTKHQVLMDVVKAYADAQAAQGNLDSSRVLLQAAQSAVSSVQRKFGRGAADIVEILNTQAALADAQQQRVRSLAEWRSARLRLMASAGTLGRRGLEGQSPKADALSVSKASVATP